MPIDPAVVQAIMLYSTVCIGLIVLGTTIVGGIAFWRTKEGAAKSFSLLVQRADATRLVAVMAIVIAAFILALIGRIEAGATVSIFSGVAGYVLGGANARKAYDNDTEGN